MIFFFFILINYTSGFCFCYPLKFDVPWKNVFNMRDFYIRYYYFLRKKKLVLSSNLEFTKKYQIKLSGRTGLR